MNRLLAVLCLLIVIAVVAWCNELGVVDDVSRWMHAKKVAARLGSRSRELALIAAIALPLQILLPAVKRSATILSRELWVDVFVYWFSAAYLRIAGFYVVVGGAREIVYGRAPHWLVFLETLPFAVQVVLYVWAHDFVVYWRHRLEHVIGFFWAFHATHHTAERIDFLTTARLHPGERFFGGILSGALAALAFDAEAASLGFSIYVYWNYFIHTNVKIKFPGWSKYLLVSPFMHHWHHAKDTEAYGKNVGVVFAWNDWLFGTAYHPQHWPSEFGLGYGEQADVGHNPLRHLVYPVSYWARRYRGWRAARPSGEPRAPSLAPSPLEP